MDTKHIKTVFTRTMNIMVILAVVLSVSTVAYAAPPSPFVGNWKATDVDGSDMSLAIGGKPGGPFKITLTDKYISFCDGEAGIVRGTGWLNENDPNLLEADLHLECFTTGAILDFHVTFRYHPATNTLSIRYSFGQVTIWHRPGPPQPPPPTLGLRVNYGHDWVESFYEPGHVVWVVVTDPDGGVRATTETITEEKDYWADWGGTGFQTNDSVWFNGEGEQIENPPDIQPYDWVYGWIDNGASAQVQIGEIFGKINLEDDLISGTIIASWITEPVIVECLDWGSGEEPPYEGMDTGPILADGSDPYSFSWAGIWDIQPGQDVGVAYHSPDGHWVANAITAPNPRIVASEVGNWFWTTDFYPGLLDLFIYEAEYEGEGVNLLWSDQRDADEGGFVNVDDLELDLVPGNYVVVSDGVNQKGLVLEAITVDSFDTDNDFMEGTAPAGRDVWVAAGPQEYQAGMWVNASGDTGDPAIGAWFADFTTLGDDGYDITEEMRTWSYAQIFDEDGDINEADPPPLEY